MWTTSLFFTLDFDSSFKHQTKVNKAAWRWSFGQIFHYSWNLNQTWTNTLFNFNSPCLGILALSEQVLVLVVSNTEACSAGLKVNMIVMDAQWVMCDHVVTLSSHVTAPLCDSVWSQLTMYRNNAYSRYPGQSTTTHDLGHSLITPEVE